MGRRGGKDLGGVEGGAAVIKIYYMRKYSIFSKGKIIKKSNT